MFENISHCLKKMFCVEDGPIYASEYRIARAILFQSGSVGLGKDLQTEAVRRLGVAIKKCVQIEAYEALTREEKSKVLSHVRAQLAHENLVVWTWKNYIDVVMFSLDDGVCVSTPRLSDIKIIFCDLLPDKVIEILESSLLASLTVNFSFLLVDKHRNVYRDISSASFLNSSP